MTIIERLNKKADSLYLHDNGLRLIDINHNESIEFIFESFKWEILDVINEELVDVKKYISIK